MTSAQVEELLGSQVYKQREGEVYEVFRKKAAISLNESDHLTFRKLVVALESWVPQWEPMVALRRLQLTLTDLPPQLRKQCVEEMATYPKSLLLKFMKRSKEEAISYSSKLVRPTAVPLVNICGVAIDSLLIHAKEPQTDAEIIANQVFLIKLKQSMSRLDPTTMKWEEILTTKLQNCSTDLTFQVLVDGLDIAVPGEFDLVSALALRRRFADAGCDVHDELTSVLTELHQPVDSFMALLQERIVDKRCIVDSLVAEVAKLDGVAVGQESRKRSRESMSEIKKRRILLKEAEQRWRWFRSKQRTMDDLIRIKAHGLPQSSIC